MVKRTCSALAVLMVVYFLSGEAVHAQQPLYGYRVPRPAPVYLNYLVIKGGMFSPEGDLKNLDTGFNGEFAYGFRFSPFAALEIGSGYFDTSGTTRASLARSSLSLDGTVYVVPLIFTLKLIAPLNPWFELYGLAGGGGYYIHASGIFTAANGRTSGSWDTGVAGGFLGAGVTWNLTRELFVGIEGKYLWTSDADVHVTIGRTRYDAHLNIEGVQATANVGFRF